MHVSERLREYLICPRDHGPLDHGDGPSLKCGACGAIYSIEDALIVHFIPDESVRPVHARMLADDYRRNSPERLEPAYYANVYHKKAVELSEATAIQTAVDLCLDAHGLVVDIGTGHGGGFVPWLAELLPENCMLFATDYCLPVVTNWTSVISELRQSFAFIDADIAEALPFAEKSIPLFTGVQVSNVGHDQPEHLFRQLEEKLTPDGRIVILERFYSQSSVTAEMLRANGNAYASIDDFQHQLTDLGLTISHELVIRCGQGKLDPADGYPVEESDRWSDKVLVIKRDSA